MFRQPKMGYVERVRKIPVKTANWCDRFCRAGPQSRSQIHAQTSFAGQLFVRFVIVEEKRQKFTAEGEASDPKAGRFSREQPQNEASAHPGRE